MSHVVGFFSGNSRFPAPLYCIIENILQQARRKPGGQEGTSDFAGIEKSRSRSRKRIIYYRWLPQIFGPSAAYVQSGLLQSVHLKLVDKIVLVLKAQKNYYYVILHNILYYYIAT